MRWFCAVLVAVGSLHIAVQALPIDEIDAEQMVANCHKLCHQCGCLGFYCGDECLCECDSEHPNDLKCLKGIAENSAKLRVPFEVLIQSPSNNRQMRSVMGMRSDNENTQFKDYTPIGSTRQTVRIYEPVREKREIGETTAQVDVIEFTKKNVVSIAKEVATKRPFKKMQQRFTNVGSVADEKAATSQTLPSLTTLVEHPADDKTNQKKRNVDGAAVSNARVRLQQARQRQQQRIRPRANRPVVVRPTRRPTPPRQRAAARPRPNPRGIVAMASPKHTMGILGKNSNEHST